MRRISPFLVVALLVGLIWSVAPSFLGGQQPVNDEHDFKGKVMALTIKGEENGLYLQDVQVKHLGTRAFVVGTYAKMTDDKDRDVVYWAPVDQISMITQFKNLEQAR